MKTQSTFAVLYWLKQASAKNGKAPLYARITVNGKRAELSLKRKVPVSDWDSGKGRLKGLGSGAKAMNNYIEQVNARLFEIYQKLRNENRLVTASIVKSQFMGDGEGRHTLSDIIDYHNAHMKETLRWGTQKNYFTTHRYIFAFLKQKHRTTDIFLSELGYRFIIDFERFLREQKSMGNNTVMKHIERLRKMVSLAYKMEWLEKDPFLKFEAKYEKKERDFLNKEELASIEAKNFEITRLQLIKDLFVFSCYTGLSYKDVMNLTAENLTVGIDGGKWLCLKREKTSVAVRLPLLSKAHAIIVKYRERPSNAGSDNLFPTISNQKLNSYLKEIADVCRIRKHLTFHVARHTFATTVTLSNGVPIETVSKLLGHKKISTTQIYARVLERKTGEDMRQLERKLEMESKIPYELTQ